VTNLTQRKNRVELKTKAEITAMKRAGELAGRALKEVLDHVQAGISTKELDRIAEKFIRKEGGVPTFIGYRGYPATICASINEEVVHGIPGNRKILAGDVVSIDIAATVDGFVGDTAATIGVEC
jgi:methionyl aminopeptidase